MTKDTGRYHALQHYSLNPLGRDLVVGDVHGCFSLLDAALKGLEFDPMRDRLFSVGDLVNRGWESLAVLDAVRRHQIKAVRGNHEQMILDWATNGGTEHVRARRSYLAGPDGNFDPIATDVSYRKQTTSALIDNGGEWFIELRSREDETDKYKTQHIVEYFTSMPLAIEIETAHGLIGVVHADVPVDNWPSLRRALARGDSEICEPLLWDRRRWRGRAVSDCIAHVTAVVVGHSPTRDVAQCGNVINIDTGAVYGDKLTILNLADVPEWLARGDRTITRNPER
ncbi:metallophosphoesterase [Burkholderia gladioli]|uniref:metallophosphoesterase n=1 Tax=Burkholderia gladioli TaxID=28095 RepID=UPI00163F382A|nr:metallophosphoesterase [Burkholderia gladioli]